MGFKPLKKITVKDVLGAKIDLRAIMPGLKNPQNPAEGYADAQVVPLVEVIGIASKYKVSQTDTGEFIRFIGQFRATNLKTGEVFVSGQCILPGAIPDLIYGALAADGARSVQFGFRIGVKYDENAIAKYVYDVESLTDIGETDPLAMLANTIKATGRLPAPAQAQAPEPEPAPVQAPEPEPEPEPAPAPSASKRARAAA